MLSRSGYDSFRATDTIITSAISVGVVAKSLRDLLVPVLFLAEGVFWLAVVATGGGVLLVFAALAGILSGVLLIAAPSAWATRPLAGASALFALALTLYQAYQAVTLVGSNLSSVGATSGALFGVFAVISIYLELAALSMGTGASSSSGAS